MHGPAIVGWLLTALCALTGVSCLLRGRGAPAPRRRAAGSEALMGFGMAVMALPAPVSVPAPPALFALFFGLPAAAALVELALLCRPSATHPGRESRTGHGDGHGVRGEAGHQLHHLVGSSAMALMALTMPATHAAPAHAGHGTGGHAAQPAWTGPSLLTGALLVYFAAYVLVTGARLLSTAPPEPAAPAPALAAAHGAPGPPPAPDEAEAPGGLGRVPGFAAACRLAMGTAMFAMLLPW
ncbi:DUF5134 domain-containing protein [Streptomyces sp. HNM0574]|uniref:DUF5134 domain-containing protein n=1 Tax=Streptomyces sp. HNM0574 TaxID=2714954 RepID=UPI00146D09D2|nr:DUF5134 domain-containing protein [Streptomyces sp. HNM0574]NLU68151.1 DUF5134 domain-containing protein [Streptomyces sp. HNM0574]